MKKLIAIATVLILMLTMTCSAQTVSSMNEVANTIRTATEINRLDEVTITVPAYLMNGMDQQRFATNFVTMSGAVHHDQYTYTTAANGDVTYTISFDYRDCYRMADAYRTGNRSNLTAEESRVLDMAIERTNRCRANAQSLSALMVAIADDIRGSVSYRTYDDINSPAFKRIASACGGFIDGYVNCQGYASMFYLMGSIAGLDVGIANGWLNGGSHTWNTLRFYGNTYYVDLTEANGEDEFNDYYYLIFGLDRCGAYRWETWNDRGVTYTTDLSLGYYTNSYGYGGYCRDIYEAADYIISEAESGRTHCRLLIMNCYDHQQLSDLIYRRAGNFNHATAWNYHYWNRDNNMTFDWTWTKW